MHRSTSPTRHMLRSLVAVSAALGVVALAGCDEGAEADGSQSAPVAEATTTDSASGTDSETPDAQASVSSSRRGNRGTATPTAKPSATAKPAPTPTPTAAPDQQAGGWWTPTGTPSWQYHLAGSPDVSVATDILISDLEETTAKQVDAVHARGGRAVCYISAGSWEDWRADAATFPSSVLGNDLDGWQGEKWFDIRATDTLLPLMAKRVAACADKGFDGIEFDNVDGYSNDTGFPLTSADQLTYNRGLAEIAHQYGLGAGLKNDVGQISALQASFDFAINESCLQWKECGTYAPFVAAGKPVLHVEYTTDMSFCSDASIAGLSSIAKRENLDAWRSAC